MDDTLPKWILIIGSCVLCTLHMYFDCTSFVTLGLWLRIGNKVRPKALPRHAHALHYVAAADFARVIAANDATMETYCYGRQSVLIES